MGSLSDDWLPQRLMEKCTDTRLPRSDVESKSSAHKS